jgi:predicted phage terminase large subunit-like protein
LKQQVPTPKDLTHIARKHYESKKSKPKERPKSSTKRQAGKSKSKILPPREVFSLSGLSDKQLQQVYDEAAIEAELGLRSFRHYYGIAWTKVEPEDFIPDAWHSDAIADHLEAVYRGDIKKLLIAVPPGAGKSAISCVLWPTWIWTQDPRWRMAFGSYGYHIANRDAERCLKLFKSKWWQDRWGHRFELTKKQVSQIMNDQGGVRAVVSVSGQTLGIRANLVVADDPLNIQEAASEIARVSVHRWWIGGMKSRGDINQREVVICQRLHDSDLIGHLMENIGGYEYLMLPAQYESGRKCITYTVTGDVFFKDPRKEEGEYLFPEKFNEEYYAERKKDPTTASLADAMYRQDPVPEGGNIIKKKWFRYYSESPEEMYKKCPAIILSADTAVKSKTSASYTVIQIWGMNGPNVYLIDQFRARLSFTGILGAFNQMFQKWPRAGAKLIEDKASGPDVIDMFKDKISGLIPSEGNDDKEDRMHAITWLWEAGNVYVPGKPPDDAATDSKPDFSHVPWMDEWYDEVVRYPASRYTDQAMAMSQALMYLARKVVNPRAQPSAISIGGHIAELRRKTAGRHYRARRW